MRRFEHAVATGAIDPEATELIVVDDGSTDATADTARRLLADLPHARVVSLASNAGKGGAARAGVRAASGAAIALMDADMAIDPTQVPQLVGALEHADIAIGSRAVDGTHVEYGSAPRTVMARTFNRIVRAVTRVDLADTQCGFKAFRAPVARLLFHFAVIEGFAFDVELLYRAHALGLRIAEVPVAWDNAQGSSIRAADPLRMVIDILACRAGWHRPPPLWVVDPRSGAAEALAGGAGPITIRGVDGVTLVGLPFGSGGQGRLALGFDRLELMSPVSLGLAACETGSVPSA
jgi:Glycosyl transferase family 2